LILGNFSYSFYRIRFATSHTATSRPVFE
jgi:hypothetical protein